MSFGGSEQSSQSQSQTQLDPDIKAALLQNYGDTKAQLAGTPTQYTGPLVAPLNSDQTDYTDLLSKLSGANIGTGALNGAVSAAQGVAGAKVGSATYNPYAAATGTAPSIGPAATATGAQINPSSLTSVSGAGPSMADIAKYMDPNVQATVDATNADLEHQKGIDLNSNAGAATMAGAFGSAGAALQNAETTNGYARTEATTDANLRSQAYSQAVAAAQADADRKLTAGQSNQNAGLTFGSTNAQLGQETDLANQQAKNTQAQAQGQIDLSTLLQNLTGENAAAGANAQGGLTASTANQDAAIANGNLNLAGATTLGSLAPEQLGLATTQAGLLDQAGDKLQTQQQNVDTATQQNWQQSLQNLLALISSRNQSLGLAGDPTIGNSSGSSQGVSLKFGS